MCVKKDVITFNAKGTIIGDVLDNEELNKKFKEFLEENDLKLKMGIDISADTMFDNPQDLLDSDYFKKIQKETDEKHDVISLDDLGEAIKYYMENSKEVCETITDEIEMESAKELLNKFIEVREKRKNKR